MRRLRKLPSYGIFGIVKNYDRLHPFSLFAFIALFILLLGILIEVKIVWQMSGFVVLIYALVTFFWVRNNLG